MSTKLQKTKSFWKTSNLFFSEKKAFVNKITLENTEENILSDDTLGSEELNNFFQNATKTLNINENSYFAYSSSSITDAIDKTINAYKSHPSILLIKKNRKCGPFFIESGFTKWTWERIEKAKFQ